MNLIPSELATCTLQTINHQSLLFSELYQSQTTLIFFVRHFGCIFCRERVTSIAQNIALFERHQLHAVVIGNGTSLMAEDFVKELKLSIPVYTDQKGQAYTLAGMKRNFGLNLSSVKDAWRSYKAGNRQGKVAGDVWQQGGVLVVDPQGHILEQHADQNAGEYIDLPALVGRIVAQKKSISLDKIS